MSVSLGLFLVAGLALSATTTTSLPVADLIEDSNDSRAVGSNLNKVYAPAPFDDLLVAPTGRKNHRNAAHHALTDDDSGGYYTSKSTKGDNGYKHFDSYHKKGGDKYGFEKHSAYGKGTGGKKGGSHETSSSYHETEGDDKGSEREYYSGEGSEVKDKKLKNSKKGAKEPKTAATDGDFYFSNYESEGGEGDSEHIEGDEGHYEDEGEGGYFSEGYSEEGEGDSEGYYEGEGEGDSEGYYDGEGESRQRSVVHHGGPSPGATSYSVRHF